jgi:hypothetical protein
MGGSIKGCKLAGGIGGGGNSVAASIVMVCRRS